MSEQPSPPRENLIRAVNVGLEFRAAGDLDEDIGDGYLGTLRVLFSPVNEWARINEWNGQFMERFAPGAWRKTVNEQASKVRALFQHGMDPQIGDKPLGPIRNLADTEAGGYGEVALLDTTYNRDLLPALRDGLYGASHRFSVVRERRDERPERSAHNPDGLEERTIVEARLFEFGPVTFPAYAGATAGVRSMTDEFLLSSIRAADPALVREMVERATDLRADVPEQQDTQEDAPSESDAAAPVPHLTDERRETTPPTRRPIYGQRRKETPPWLLGPSKNTKRT